MASCRVTTGSTADQMTVILLGPSRGDTLWTVALADLGDGPQAALAALISPGPQVPGQGPLGWTDS